MQKRSINRISYLLSISLHLIIAFVITIVKLSTETETDEFVTIGFGTVARAGSSGQKKEIVEQKPEIKKPEEKVKLPEAKNTDDNKIVTETKEKKEDKKEKQPEEEDQGRETTGDKLGQYGIEFDWGGKGIRKIYSFIIPPYPAGVSKEIDVKLRFLILPDGTVGKIFPLIKADTRLEMAAINSLRQWRFEPLPSGKKQIAQTAVITFPFRLR